MQATAIVADIRICRLVEAHYGKLGQNCEGKKL